MRKLVEIFIFVLSAWVVTLTVPAFAQDTGAQANGNWGSASTWTGGTVPNSSNNVYIGSTYPAGAAGTATVTLTAPESASSLHVGYGSPTSGTLNLGGNKLTITNGLTIGDFGGTGTINEAGGSLTAASLSMYTSGTSFTFGSADAVGSIDIENGAALTTAANGNITTGGSVAFGSTLTVGANTTLSGGLNVESSGSTLNLADNNLSVAGTLWLGYFQTSAVNVNRGSGTPGTLTVANLDLGNSQNLSLVAGDTITNIDVETGANLTTAAIGNITTGGSVANDGTLTLGANASLSGGLNVESSGSTLNLAGHNLSVDGTLWLGYFQTSAVNLNRGSGTPGTLTVANLDLGNSQNLALIAGDTITNIDVENGATLTTAANGNITTGGSVAYGSTLTLGANTSLSGGLNVESSGSTLNLGGHDLSVAGTLWLGYFQTSAVNLNRGGGTPGTLNLGSLFIGNGQNLTLIPGDTITNALSGGTNIYTGATLTTAATSNITTSVNVVDGTLDLGADLSIGNQTVNAESGSTVNLAGHNLIASYLLLGYDGTSTVTLNRGSGTPGNLNLGNLFLGNGQNLTLIPGDTINAGDNGVNVTAGATLTTAATSNITNNVVNVETGGTVKLGAGLNSAGNLNVQDSGSTFNAQGNAVTAVNLLFGSNGTAPVTVSNLGAVTATELLEGNGTSVTLHGGDVINSVIDLASSSVLTVQQSSGGTGLTLNGTLPSSLTIDPSSMDLIFTLTTAGNWDFRWQDPNGSTNWISTLDTMTADQQINLTLPSGQTYEVLDSNGYTYIEGVAVPEPTSLMLLGLGLAGLGTARVRRRPQVGVGFRAV